MQVLRSVAPLMLLMGAWLLLTGCSVQVQEAPSVPLEVGATATAMMAGPDGTALGNSEPDPESPTASSSRQS